MTEKTGAEIFAGSRPDARAELRERGSIRAARAGTFIILETAGFSIAFRPDDFATEEELLRGIQGLRRRSPENGQRLRGDPDRRL